METDIEKAGPPVALSLLAARAFSMRFIFWRRLVALEVKCGL
jgi:hypothetical protein